MEPVRERETCVCAPADGVSALSPCRPGMDVTAWSSAAAVHVKQCVVEKGVCG